MCGLLNVWRFSLLPPSTSCGAVHSQVTLVQDFVHCGARNLPITLIKTEDANESRDLADRKTWDAESIKQVTEQLFNQINKLSKKDASKEAKPSGAPPNLDVSEAPEVQLNGPEVNNNSGEKPLIVISAHPKQSSTSREIKQILSPFYSIWCSNDLADTMPIHRMQEDMPTHLRDSIYDPNLSPIIEETSTLTHAIQDYARKIAENSKQRPKSVPNNSSEFKLEKKDLTRMVSHSGEVSYLSSISPDKMERLKCFQEKVHNCNLVIVIGSDQFYKSRTSEQHVYYCAQRMKTILVQSPSKVVSPFLTAQGSYTNAISALLQGTSEKASPEPPVWFSKLMSHDVPLVSQQIKVYTNYYYY